MSKYIDADEMIKNEAEAYANTLEKTEGTDIALPNLMTHLKIQKMLEDTPAADVAPVAHAHWKYTKILTNGMKLIDGYKCSHCELLSAIDKYAFCPQCGAKMDEEAQK